MTSIGSLMSLWLGISALDVRVIVEVLIRSFKNIIIKLGWICFANECFYNLSWFVLKAIHYLNLFKKSYLKKITILLSFICFMYQLIQLTLEFTQFKTTIHVKLADLVANFSEYPAISFCTNELNANTLTKINLNSSDNNDNKRLKAKFPQMINGLNIEERNISKYLILAKNEIPEYIRCTTYKDKGEVCIDKNSIIMSFSNLGQCYTLNPLRYSISEKSKFSRDLIIFYSKPYLLNSEVRNHKREILVHDSKELPSLTYTDRFTPFIKIAKVERLPAPYDSNCFDYENSKSFKSRGQCINDCVLIKILKKYDCIPRESANVLTLYDNMTLNSTFCVDNSFEDLGQNDCSDGCLKPCKELLFISFEASQVLHYNEGSDVIYINNPYMTFIYFMSTIGGLLGLWNNISIYDIQLIFIKICAKIFKSKLIKKLLNYFLCEKISKLFDLIRSFVIKINFKVKKIFIQKLFILN
jgi:hypothetical protein